MRTHRLGAVAVAGLLVLGACGDDSSSDTTEAPADTEAPAGTGAATDVCEARDNLRSAITDLGELNVLQDGTDAVRQYVDQVQAAVDDLRSAAGDQYEEESAAVEDALERVRTALDDGVSVDALREAASAVGDLVTSLGSLVSAIEEAC
jgi:hypothetical protein